MIVDPAGSNRAKVNTDGSLQCTISGGGGGGGGVAQTQVRNSADNAWVNVGTGAETGTALHVPVRIQGTGANVVEPLNAAPSGSEYAIPVRTVGAGGGGTSSNFGAAFPAGGTASGYSDGTNMQGARVFDADTGAGTQYVAGCNLRLSANGGSVELGTASNPLRVDPTGTTTQGVSIISPGTLALDATITARLNTLGQKTMANSTPVALASDQSALPVTGTFWQATQPVSGTFWQATQPVSGTFWPTTAGAPLSGQLSDGAAFYVGAKTGQLPAALDGSGFLKVHEQGTATISGTVTANAGTGNFTVVQSTPANLTATVTQGPAAAASGAWTAKITDGTNTGAVKAASTAAAATDPAQVVSFAGANSATKIGDGTNNAAVKAASTPAAATDPAVVVSFAAANSSCKINDGTTTAAVIAGTTALKTDMSSVAGTATVTAAAGVQKVGIVGNANAALDAANNAAAPANVLVAGVEAQSSALSASATAGNVRRAVAGLDGVLYTRPGGPLLFTGAVTAIGATLTQVIAAPAASTSLYLTDIMAISDTATAGQFTLRYGTGANCATGTTTIFPAVAALTTGKIPYPGNTASVPYYHHRQATPIKIPAANALCVICVATNTCTLQLTGFTGP